MEQFMRDLLALCQRYGVQFDACSCCRGVNLSMGEQRAVEVEASPERVTWTQYDGTDWNETEHVVEADA